jgi:hypothetical protein
VDAPQRLLAEVRVNLDLLTAGTTLVWPIRSAKCCSLKLLTPIAPTRRRRVGGQTDFKHTHPGDLKANARHGRPKAQTGTETRINGRVPTPTTPSMPVKETP